MRPLADANDHLAEMLGRLQVAICSRRLVKRKYLVDDRPEPTRRNGAVHGFEHLAGADQYALQICASGKNQHRVDLGGAGEHTDHRDLATDTNGTQRLRQGPRSTNFDDVVYASAA